MARCVVSLDGSHTLRSAPTATPTYVPGRTGLPLPRHAWRASATTTAPGGPRRSAFPDPLRAHGDRRGSRGGPGPRCQPGQPPPLAATLRGRWHRGPAPAATGPGDGEPAGLAGAGHHRGAPAHVPGQQTPRRGAHASRHLPARAPCHRCAPCRAGHGTALGAAGAGSSLRAEPARRALAHRHQGPLLPAADPRRLHEGLDRRARRRSQPASSSACASCPGRAPSPSSPGCATASSCAGSRTRS